MIYKSCPILEHGIMFTHENVRNCCMYYTKDNENVLFPKYFADKEFSIDDIIKKKRELRENVKKGIFPKGCINCHGLEEQDWDNDDYINVIFISHWTKCNCNCFYCYFDYDKKKFQHFKHKPLLPVLKEMKEKHLIRNSGYVAITGGEIGELKEFDDILNFCLEVDFHSIVVNSSCIKYKKSIEKGLKKDKIEFTVSLDSGNKELYKKIKRMNSFDRVVKHIKQYIQAQGENKYNVRVKYIILPNVNDSIEQLNEWIDLCCNIGVKHIILDVETSYFVANQHNIPKHIYDMVSFAEQKAKEKGMKISYYAHALQLKHDI